MDATILIERAQVVFRTVFDAENLKLSRELTAYDVEGWDSLTHIQLIQGLEREFKVKFKAVEVMAVKNVGELLDLISQKLKVI